jgi:hypothetical protein
LSAHKIIHWPIAKISEVRFSSFDFLDEHHILYSMSKDDSIYVYDLRRPPNADQNQPQQNEQETEAGMKPVGFQLALPPIHRMTTSRYIQIRRNALPSGTAPPFSEGGKARGSSSSSSAPPFYADPRERLIVLRIATSPVERGEEQFELHVPARALIDHHASVIATERRRRSEGGHGHGDGDVVVEGDAADLEAAAEAEAVPWPEWRDAVRTTPPQRVPYVIPARMVNYGMRVVSHPPDWEEGVLHVDSYPPRRSRRRRRRTREAGGESANAEVVGAMVAGGGGGGGGMCGMRQAVGLPGDAEAKAGLLSVLCEDALLCYKVSGQGGRDSFSLAHLLLLSDGASFSFFTAHSSII